jgi:hypothetical protein
VCELDHKIAGMLTSMNSFHDEVSKKLSAFSINLVQDTDLVNASTSYRDVTVSAKENGKLTNNSISYADAVNKNIENAVKSVVTETFRKQRSDERTKATVAIYGLPELGRDLTDINDLFAKLKCSCRVLHYARIGRAESSLDTQSTTNQPRKPRPIKVELSASIDCNQLLAAFKRLKHDCSATGISIARWIQRSEMAKHNVLRQRCQTLNSSAVPMADGRKPYIVISGRLMKRAADGKLLPYMDEASDGHVNVQKTTDLTPAGSTAANQSTNLQSANASVLS